MDSPSSSKMTVASFLTSGSMRIVVAGMFDGMVVPFLVYHGATILSSLCGGCDPVVHIGRQDVEHVADTGRARAVGELTGDRGLRRAGVGRHEGAAPAEPVEVGAEVFGGHALEASHERIEERMDGVDAVDGPLGAVLGIVRLMQGDLQVMQHIDICGSLVRGDDRACADTAAKGFRRALARDNPSPRDLEEGGVRVADARHYANLLAGEAALVNLLAAMACPSRQGE